MTQFADADFSVETTTATEGGGVPQPAPVAPPPPPETSDSDLDAAEADAGDSSVETPAPEVESDAAKAERERDEKNGRFKKKDSLQQRIDRAVAQQREAERRAADLEAKLKAVTTPPPADDGRPKREDFDDWDEYQDRLVDWRVAQRLEADRRAEETRQATARDAEIAQAYTARVTAFAAATPDFSVAIARAAGVPISAVIQRAVFESEHGPQLAYHLATHPEDALQWTERTKALDLSAAAVVREWLEGKILAAPASSGPVAASPRPSVPAPIKPVGSAPVVTSDGPPPDDAPFEVHKAWYDAQDRKRRR
jgi:hypothetical protein